MSRILRDLKFLVTYPKNSETISEIDALLQGVPWNVPQELSVGTKTRMLDSEPTG